MISLILTAIVALAVAVEPQDEQQERVEQPTFQFLVEQATKHVRKEFPDNPFNPRLPARVTRYPDHWEVTWVLPPDTMGGTPTVWLDRETLEVTKVVFHQ